MATTSTLLEIVQGILSDMSSDSVNDISDTVESLRVADVVKDTYYYLIGERDRPWLKTLTKLESAVSPTLTKMKIPENIAEVLTVKYNIHTSSDTDANFKTITYCTTDDFLDKTLNRDQSAADTDLITDTGYDNVPFLIKNDQRPSYWTSFDDEYIIFDSYDSTVDSVLQASKTIIHAIRIPEWTLSNTFVPDLPSHMFPQLIAEAKAAAFILLKQVANPVAERRNRKLKTRNQHAQHKQSQQYSGPHYGRK